MSYSRWWADRRFGNNESLSILDLVNSGELDCKLAGLLWFLLEHRASILVASGPVFAGKTTLLHALLDFLPPDLHRISLKGYYEDFKFLDHSSSDHTYMVAEEISNHGYDEYLWGLQAVRVFQLLEEGYALGATIHARTSEEVIYVLNRALGIPLTQLCRLGVIVNLRAMASPNYNDEPIRFVNSVDLILTAPEGMAIHQLAVRQHSENEYNYQAEDSLEQALVDKYSIPRRSVNPEIETRTQFLKHLLGQCNTSRQEVKNAIQEYHRSKFG